MAISPWPNAGTQARTAAIGKLRRVVIFLEDDERASEVGELASALVERYAPSAPAAAKDEACIRFAGYLSQSASFGAIRKGVVGPIDIEYVTNHSAIFFRSGAAMMLQNWRIFRAGVIE